MSRKSLVQVIKNDWGENPQSSICIAVLDYLMQSSMELTHITYGRIRGIVGGNFSDQDIFSSVQYLCREPIHLLEMGFELIENDSYIEISRSEMREARKTGKLLHPERGTLLEDYEERVFLYFYPSELSKEIKS